MFPSVKRLHITNSTCDSDGGAESTGLTIACFAETCHQLEDIQLIQTELQPIPLREEGHFGLIVRNRSRPYYVHAIDIPRGFVQAFLNQDIESLFIHGDNNQDIGNWLCRYLLPTLHTINELTVEFKRNTNVTLADLLFALPNVSSIKIDGYRHASEYNMSLEETNIQTEIQSKLILAADVETKQYPLKHLAILNSHVHSAYLDQYVWQALIYLKRLVLQRYGLWKGPRSSCPRLQCRTRSST